MQPLVRRGAAIAVPGLSMRTRHDSPVNVLLALTLVSLAGLFLSA